MDPPSANKTDPSVKLLGNGGQTIVSTGPLLFFDGQNDYSRFISCDINSMPVGGQTNIAFGQSASTNNHAEIGFHYQGNQSPLNYCSFSLYGTTAITFNQTLTVPELDNGHIEAIHGALSHLLVDELYCNN